MIVAGICLALLILAQVAFIALDGAERGLIEFDVVIVVVSALRLLVRRRELGRR
jgi:hypothetical protein